jgi:lipopolysaccharide/colanic/teichoic acid biosynthesis glycosyltransferase
MTEIHPHYPLAKRIFDILFAVLALVVLSPLILIVSALLLFRQGPPLFFCQERPGLGGKIFRLCKFRSMQPSPGNENQPDRDAVRITPMGKLLRRTSLDELPELINVLKGEMSIVGPRPLLVQYLERYSAEQARRHEMPPGITGWAQVNGRNEISWEERFKLDIWYIDHWSLWLDIRIILITLWKVLSGEGISQPGRATMDEFMGSDIKDKF